MDDTFQDIFKGWGLMSQRLIKVKYSPTEECVTVNEEYQHRWEYDITQYLEDSFKYCVLCSQEVALTSEEWVEYQESRLEDACDAAREDGVI